MTPEDQSFSRRSRKSARITILATVVFAGILAVTGYALFSGKPNTTPNDPQVRAGLNNRPAAPTAQSAGGENDPSRPKSNTMGSGNAQGAPDRNVPGATTGPGRNSLTSPER